MDAQELEDFDLKPKEVEVRMSGALYVVKEASAEVGKRHRALVIKACRIEGGKLAGVAEGLADVEPALVAGCLFRRKTDDKGETTDTPVSMADILKWPDRIQKRLAEIAKSISDLDAGETDPKKSNGGEPSSVLQEISESISTN